jgi:hypothetical protein
MLAFILIKTRGKTGRQTGWKAFQNHLQEATDGLWDWNKR